MISEVFITFLYYSWYLIFFQLFHESLSNLITSKAQLWFLQKVLNSRETLNMFQMGSELRNGKSPGWLMSQQNMMEKPRNKMQHVLETSQTGENVWGWKRLPRPNLLCFVGCFVFDFLRAFFSRKNTVVLSKRKQVELKWGIKGKEVAKRINKILAGETEIFLEWPSVTWH